MLLWTCLKIHVMCAAVWRVDSPAGAIVLKQHRHPRPFAQELQAYRDWLPGLLDARDAPHLRGPSDSQQPHHRGPSDSQQPHLRGPSDSQQPHLRGPSDSQHPHLRGPSGPQEPHLRSSSDSHSPLLGLPEPLPPAPAREPGVHDLLAVRVPALLASDRRSLGLALSAAPGERLYLGTHDSPSTLAAHAAAGRFLRALHQLPAVDDDPIPLVAAVAARLDAWHARARDILSPAERDALQRLAARRDAFAGVRRVPCHRDFTPDNWLLAGDALHVLDFEHARLDAAEADLVKLCADTWAENPALAEAFLAGHGSLDTDAAARLDVLLALHAVATLAWAERHADPDFHALGRRALAVALDRVT
ncbi:phosphotransferase enzyme family protein [Nannocystis bainbridge]|uniref:Aminoglycoside phosphotransferase domain-containing protein n=1 Tax=Nannocystis bainbridge TaxID=2995303 RepID=A0ABT5DYL4_9BACT|nr:phosphotransferase [Nannocystis bainbridge]MDC0718228.1 hypothetical protein [Nannocystis bainbridge]